MHWELCAWSGCSHRLAGLGFACPLCRCRLQNHVIGIVVIVAEIIIVVVPTLLGAALGLWLDKHYPGKQSWTLALLVAGLTLGCFNAWHWVAKEDKAMRDEREDHDE